MLRRRHIWRKTYKYSSQGNTKIMMGTDKYKSINPETYDVN